MAGVFLVPWEMSAQYANLVIAKLEEESLLTCMIKPLAYFHYIDDFLIIWTSSEDELLSFQKILNKFQINDQTHS